MAGSDAKTETKPESSSAPDAKAAEAPAAVVTLEEDDEFEDFPAEDWADEEADISIPGGKEHLWEENWDADDADDDFSNQLREELKSRYAGK
ncbi:DSS1/SEM1 family-domain-containing protein [Limtongia smithiae]|uniref:DSS1/SEM1 family-domain-containing protein n=1 Tax=Limtongia smithiae TaxID=1125753 RepID=UPI0034CDDBF7